MKAEIGEIVVAGVFVESQRSGEHAAAGVGQTDHIEVSLENTVLARRSVDGNVGEVEGMLHARTRKRKIILIDRTSVLGMPILRFKDHDSHIVTRFANPSLQSGS